MQLALIYLAISGLCIALLTLVLRRSPSTKLGASYIRAGLIWSFLLTGVDLLLFGLLGTWVIPVPAAICVGFVMAPAMIAMT